VRFRDLDPMGHVNNAVTVTYFEHGRAAFFRDHFGVQNISDIDFIVARMERVRPFMAEGASPC
jgi:acyl-CoA thioester hydrolase